MAAVQRERRRATPRAGKRRRAFALLAVIISLGLIAAVLYRPVTRLVESRNSLLRAEERLAEERAKTQELEERLERDLSEEYVEGEARRMGYVKPGEIPLIVLDDKDGAPGEGDTEEGAEEEKNAASGEASP